MNKNNCWQNLQRQPFHFSKTSVANSSEQQLENGTKSNQSAIDSMTKTSQDLSQAIDLASAILRHKKSARISLAKFLSKLYNFPVQTEDLH